MAKDSTIISAVIPIYCCENTIKELHSRLTSALGSISPHYEIVFVNDHSPENDWTLIQEICAKDPKVKGINLSRNFGQHYAVTAGLHNSSGEWVVVMDGDLEDAPEDILKLYEKAQEGYDIVYADYSKRSKPVFIMMFSVLYHRFFNFLVNNSEEKGNAKFVIIKRQVVEHYNKITNKKRHFGPLLHTLGFKDYKLPIVAQKVENHSSYTLSRKINLAITSIISHSTILLRLSIYIGFILSFCAFAFGLYITWRKILGFPVEMGWSSIIVSMYFLSGLIMIIAGILGMYIESIIYEVGGTPIYVIRDKLNFKD